MDSERYDLLLKNAHVLCIDAEQTEYAPGFVAVKDGLIAALGPMAACPPQGAREEIDCSGCALLPGLINLHTHLPMVYFRGIADDLPLTEWLEQHIWPAESRFLNPDFVYQATLLAVAESLKCGVTCVNDMYLFAHDVGRACADAGMRAYVGEGVMSFATPSAESPAAGLRLTRELIAAYDGHALVTPTVCAHATYTCDEPLLQELHALAQEHGLLFNIHLHETFDETDRTSWAVTDESPVHALKRIGVLGPRLIAAHCVWVDDHDLHHMYESGCAVAHCPTSNLKLGSGIAPVHSMTEAGVPVGVGTDGAASNNNLNLWEEIHLAALLAKGVYKSANVVPAATALAFATSQGAQALCASHFGSLVVGKQADMITVRLEGIHLTPVFPRPNSLAGSLVYGAQGSDVRDTIVAGRVLMRNRQLTQLDEEALKAQAQAWVKANFS